MLSIRSLTLSHVAGVEHAHLTVPDTGVLVVHGPNEAGKSTLLRAIRLLLDDTPTSSRKREVKALKDVSADEPTTISAELTVGDHELTLTKAYNKGSGRCELTVTAPRAESLTGREASDRFAEIMRGEVDTDLLDALTVEQGESLDPLVAAGLGPLERALGDGAGDLSGRAEGSDGQIATGDGGGAASLVERIAVERARYFTPGGKPSKELKAAQDDLATALREHAAAEKAYDQAQKLIADLERLRAEKRTVSQQEPQAREEATAAAEALEKGLEQHRKLEEQRAVLTRATQVLELAEQRLQVRADRVAEFDAAVEARGRAADAVEEATASAEGEQRREKDLRDALAEARREARTTMAFRTYLAARAQRDVVEETASTLVRRRDTAAAISGEIEETRQSISENPVTGEMETAVHRAAAEAHRARSVRDAAATMVEVSGTSGDYFTLDGEEQRLEDEPTTLRMTTRRELTFGDVTVTVTPARDSLRDDDGTDLDGEVNRATEELEAALVAAGVDSPEGVVEAAEARRRLQELLAEQRLKLSQATGGLSMDELDRRVVDNARARQDADDAVTAARDLIAREDPDKRVDLPDEDTVGADELDRRVEHAEARVEEIREELDTLARAGAAVLLASRVEERERASARVGTVEAALEAMRAEVADARLTEDVESAHRDVDVARSELDQLTRDLNPGAGDVETLQGLADGAQERVTRLRDRADRISHEISGANGALGEHSGVAERLESRSTALQRARRTLERVDRQAQAAETLHQAVQTARDDARRRYEAPYRASVENLARTLYGRAVSIEFDDDLSISRRVLDATALDAAQLSGGAREQLAILSRLAVADIVGGGEGVPVVIDDALGFSDTARIHRMNLVLSQLGRTNQIIILTCDPARFDSVPGATVTSMAEL